MTKLIRVILTGFSLSLLSLNLSGCLLAGSNTADFSSDPNATLPYLPESNKALVYVVQPYVFGDMGLLGGALSDGNRYHGSKIYLKSAHQSQAIYLGLIYASFEKTSSLCFYVSPGQYHLIVGDHKAGVNPASLEKTLNLKAKSVSILGVKMSTYSGGVNTNISLVPISLAKGKSYLTKHKPQACMDLNQRMQLAEGEAVRVKFVLNIHNQMRQYQIYHNSREDFTSKQSGAVLLASHAGKTVIKPGETQTYTQTWRIPNTVFLKSGMNSRQMYEFVLSKTYTVNPAYGNSAGVYVDALLPQRSSVVAVNMPGHPYIKKQCVTKHNGSWSEITIQCDAVFPGK